MFRRVLTALVSGALVGAGILAMPQATLAEEAYLVPPGGVFDLTGKGFGHGHGMSQYGAKDRGEAGQSLTSILGFYYPGTTSYTRTDGWLSVILTNSGAEGVKPATGNASSRYQCDDTSADAAVSCSVQIVPQGGLAARARTTGAPWTTLPTTLGADTVTMWSVKRVESDTKLLLSGLTSAGWQDVGTAEANGFVFSRSGSTTQLLYGNGTRVDYLGEIHLFLTAPNLLARVNAVKLESYLRGVVPREMPAGWHPTALRAQAVAARSYATHDAQNPLVPAWQTCDSTSCQVYRGVRAVSSSGAVTQAEVSTDDAIKATVGKIRTYGGVGRAAFTQFSASNGGYMSAGSQPYLVAAPDPYDTYPAWTASLTAAALQTAYPAVGTLDRLVVVSRDGKGTWGGRIVNARLEGHKNGTATTVAVTGDALRSVAGLRSTYVTVLRPVTDPHDRFGAASAGAGAADLVSRTSAGSLVHRTWSATGGLGAPTVIGGITTYAPAVVAPQAGQLEAYVQGADGAVWTTSRATATSAWKPWTSLGGKVSGRPAAVVLGSDVQVFARGADGAVWTRTRKAGTWTAWVSIGGSVPAGYGVTATSPGSGSVAVFARGTDRALKGRSWSSATGWAAWKSFGGVITTDPSAVSDSPGRAVVVARGADNAAWAVELNGATAGAWTKAGGALASAPVAVAQATGGRVDVVANGTDGRLWTASRSGGVWSAWTRAE